MFIVNPESLKDTKIYYCKSPNLMKFLCEIKGFSFISREQIEGSHKFVWMFVKSKELDEALREWKENKERGVFAFRGVR
jgi:hypothetical protein